MVGPGPDPVELTETVSLLRENATQDGLRLQREGNQVTFYTKDRPDFSITTDVETKENDPNIEKVKQQTLVMEYKHQGQKYRLTVRDRKKIPRVGVTLSGVAIAKTVWQLGEYQLEKSKGEDQWEDVSKQVQQKLRMTEAEITAREPSNVLRTASARLTPWISGINGQNPEGMNVISFFQRITTSLNEAAYYPD